MPYHIDHLRGLINCAGLENTAYDIKPRIIVAGAPAYTRKIDYIRVSQVANKVGLLIHDDEAQIYGFVAIRDLRSSF